MSLVERFIILCPYLGESTIRGLLYSHSFAVLTEDFVSLSYVQSVTVELSVQINLSDLLNSESHHLAAAVNDSHVAFYLDGSLRGTRALSGGGLSDEGGGVIYVGGWDGSYYEGDLQDVRIYLDSLSER